MCSASRPSVDIANIVRIVNIADSRSSEKNVSKLGDVPIASDELDALGEVRIADLPQNCAFSEVDS